jgi:Na+/H+ antiporter
MEASFDASETNLVPDLEFLVALLAVVAAVAVASKRLKIPPPILLVVTGVILATIRGMPTVELAPSLVLLVVLPPVIYTAAVAMSWREFQFNLRPITALAIGCVTFTTVAVAAATHWLLGLPWPVGFVLGAIVSPPDVMAPLAIARRMQIPRRILVILEGEGLANDAAALIFYRFAVAAVSLGTFSLLPAVGLFTTIIVGEILWGLALGFVMLRLRRWVHDTRIEITLSVLTPFLAFWPPEHLGGSGVIATVAAGLYTSWNGPHLISATTRLQGLFFWDFVIYLVEGMVFLITGLQARPLFARIADDNIFELATAVAIVSVVVIVARFVWVYPAAYLPRRFSARIRRKEPEIPWQAPFAVAFTGVRGIVSLAAALAIPLTTASGEAFPDRDLILFLTFSVILVTLVGQGLLLPWVVRLLGLTNLGRTEHDEDRAEEDMARRHSIQAVLDRLDSLATEKAFTESVIQPLRILHRDRLLHIERRRGDDDGQKQLAACHEAIELLLIEAERQKLRELFCAGTLKDEARRRIERELDLREAHLANQRAED